MVSGDDAGVVTLEFLRPGRNEVTHPKTSNQDDQLVWGFVCGTHDA